MCQALVSLTRACGPSPGLEVQLEGGGQEHIDFPCPSSRLFLALLGARKAVSGPTRLGE